MLARSYNRNNNNVEVKINEGSVGSYDLKHNNKIEEADKTKNNEGGKSSSSSESKKTEELVQSLGPREQKFEPTHPDGAHFEEGAGIEGITGGQIDPYIDITKFTGIGQIPQGETRQFIQSAYIDPKKIYVSYDASNQKFSFSDLNGTPIGSFRVEHLIKYMTSFYDIRHQFLNFVDREAYDQAKALIKSFVGYPEVNKKIKYCHINLLDVQQSPFMGDIEMLVRLNDLLYTFEVEMLDRELNYVELKYRPHIKRLVKQLIYMLLNYTLKMIAFVSEEIQHKEGKERLKEQLVKYSIGISYRISTFVQEQLGVIQRRNIDMEKLLADSHQTRKFVGKKMDNLINLISTQNSYLQNRLQQQQIGGKIKKVDPNKVLDNGEPDFIEHFGEVETNTDKGLILSERMEMDSSDGTKSTQSTRSTQSSFSDHSSEDLISDSHFSAIYDI